jgi:hypothetical protein
MFNHAYSPSQLSGTDYLLFKKALAPEWDNPKFMNGGRWVMRLDKREARSIDDMWLSMVLALIGGAFADLGGCNNVAGAIVSVRNHQCKVSLWIVNASRKEQILAIGKCFQKVLADSPGLADLVSKDMTFEDFEKERIVLQLPTHWEKGGSTIGIFQ